MKTWGLRYAVRIVLALLAGGCSGGGRDIADDVRPAGSFLDDQATLAALNMHWLPTLFPTTMRQTAGQCPYQEPEVIENPDGSVTIRYRRTDCAEAEWLQSADGLHQEGRTVYPDGGVETEVLDIEFLPDLTAVITDRRVFPDGARAETTITTPYWDEGEENPLINSQEGRLVLPDGRQMDFRMKQYALHYELEVDGHEGWLYNLRTPTVRFLELPDTSQAATGSLSGGGRVLAFTMEARPGAGRWDAMSVTAPGGLSGTFELDASLTGRGTVLQAGQMLMSVLWGSGGEVRATYADGLTDVGRPSAAARDFLVDQWMWKLSEYGPSPR